MNDIEIWRDINGYEGLYQVSSLGRVKSLNYNRTHTEKTLKPHTDKRGYVNVVISLHNKVKLFHVGNLVAKHFPEICGEWFEGAECDHINTIKSDNRAINLKVCTHTQNMNNPLTLKHKSNSRIGFVHSQQTKEKISLNRKGKCFGENAYNSRIICQCDKQTGEVIKIFNCVMDAERMLGISNKNICAVCRGRKKSAGGFKWRYA